MCVLLVVQCSYGGREYEGPPSNGPKRFTHCRIRPGKETAQPSPTHSLCRAAVFRPCEQRAGECVHCHLISSPSLSSTSSSFLLSFIHRRPLALLCRHSFLSRSRDFYIVYSYLYFLNIPPLHPTTLARPFEIREIHRRTHQPNLHPLIEPPPFAFRPIPQP